jgi:peptidyl-dipeptidase Dcp
LSLTSLKYGQNILAQTNSYELVVLEDLALDYLKGLIDAATADAAKGKEGRFCTSNSELVPFYNTVDEIAPTNLECISN